MKINLLAFGAHPDDVELSCSGTLLLHKSLGYSTGVVDLTAGELGTRGSAELRAKESQHASEILQLNIRENLGFKDGFFCNDERHLHRVIQAIRQYQPDIVLANAVKDRHPDHARAAALVADACFYSGLRKIITRDNKGEQVPWRPKAIYHYVQFDDITPDFVVDISAFMEQKMESIRAYSSQFYDPDSKEPSTIISSKAFIDSILQRCALHAKALQVDYAEAFTTARTPGVKNLFHLI